MKLSKKVTLILSAVLLSSCSLKEDHKAVAYQENQSLPAPPAEECTVPAPYCRATDNLIGILSKVGSGSGIFINPTQILTANHVIKESSLEYQIRNKLRGEIDISDRIGRIDRDDREVFADLAVVNLTSPLPYIHSLEFSPSNLEVGQPVTFLSYNYVKSRASCISPCLPGAVYISPIMKQGKITQVFQRNGVEKIETDIPVIPGNSGGVYLDEQGRILGVLTNFGTTNPETTSEASTVSNLQLELRHHDLSPFDAEIAQLRNDEAEMKTKLASIGYNDFASGRLYLDATGNVCQKDKFIPLVDNCFPREYLGNITGVKTMFSTINGVGTLETTVNFKDGRVYNSKTPHIDTSFKSTLGSRVVGTSITVSGEGVSPFN